MAIDPEIQAFATGRQWEVYCAVQEHGSQYAAARALGCYQSNVSQVMAALQARCIQRGYSPDHDMTHPAPPGFVVKGTSTYYGKDGARAGQWVKTKIDPDYDPKPAIVEGLKGEILPAEPVPVPGPAATVDDYLAAYIVGDHHFGMLAWREEVGEDWDLDIAERSLCEAMDALVARSEPASEALVVIMGDFLHYDGMAAVTPQSGHELDSDSRFGKVIRAALRSIRYLVRAAASRHQSVRLIMKPGNHDPSSTLLMLEGMAMLYENDPRIAVDTTPSKYSYHEFGRNLLMMHHGDAKAFKPETVPLLLASDQPEAWGRTTFRHVYTAHTHKERLYTVPGAKVESFAVLPPADAWAHANGWRSDEGMNCINYHRDGGWDSRYFHAPRLRQISAA